MTDSKKITINQNGFWGGEFPFAEGKIIDRKPMLAVEDEHSEMVLDEVEKAIAEGRQSVYIDWETWDWVIEGVVPVGHQAWILDDEGRYVHKFLHPQGHPETQVGHHRRQRRCFRVQRRSTE